LQTAGELLDHLAALEPHERRGLLDQARAHAGLESTAAIDARERTSTFTVRTLSRPAIPTCPAEGCTQSPCRPGGGLLNPSVVRWWCPAHEHLAEPGDMDERGSGIVLSPSGVPVPYDPAADAAEQAREASRRAQLQTEAEIRAVEAAELRASNEARDAAHRRELPEHMRGPA
jgi:hypothetical protein